MSEESLLRRIHELECERNAWIKKYAQLDSRLKESQPSSVSPAEVNLCRSGLKPLGFLSSVFKEKNGTPRQGNIVPNARAKIKVLDSAIDNPATSLCGIDEFSHVWILFVFHGNTNSRISAKVRPPRLNGEKKGVFATRSPHRPNPIGITLAKLDRVSGSTLFLSGVDLIDGTPIVDIKPFVSAYDAAPQVDCREASWLTDPTVVPIRTVVFSKQSLDDLHDVMPSLQFYCIDEEHLVVQTIEQIVTQDPRNLNMRRKHRDGTFGFCFDKLNVLYQINDSASEATIVRMELWPEGRPEVSETRIKRGSLQVGLRT